MNPRDGLVTIGATVSSAFGTNGAQISGTNWLMKWDPISKNTKWKTNLTETSQGLYGGFQDVEHDPLGNVFVVGTFPSSLLWVSSDGKGVTQWYLKSDPQTGAINHTERGIGGIAAWDWTLLAQGDTSGALWRFDMRAERGTPIPVTITSGNHTFADSDAILLPPKYNGTALLVAEDNVGISVFKSTDDWTTAQYKGLVKIGQRERDEGTSVTASVQIGGSLYEVLEPFGDEGLGGPGDRGKPDGVCVAGHYGGGGEIAGVGRGAVRVRIYGRSLSCVNT